MNKKIDDILNGLQEQQPVLFNEDELTNMIMDNLPDIQLDPIEEKEMPASEDIDTLEQTSEEPRQTPPRILTIIRTVSSVAAIWLIGLFAYTYTDLSATDINTAVAENNRTEKPSGVAFRSSTLNVVYSYRMEKNKASIYQQIKKIKNI